jgi:hypothetical protein
VTTLAFRRPTVLPIHPQTWIRPTGNTDFRVTQRFAVPDSFYGGSQQHNAVDLGNFRCGDAVVAMAPGIARRTQDNATALGAKTDALGMIVDHGNGIQSEYWHLQGYAVASGVRVATGQHIASVGRTGLGDVCHLHVEVKRFGVRIDPEPLMFGTPLTIEEDSPMDFGGAELASIPGSATFTLTTGSHFRSSPERTDTNSLQVFPKGQPFSAAFTVKGEAIGGNDQWHETRLYTGSKYRLGYIHTSVATRQDAPTTDGSKAELDAALVQISALTIRIQLKDEHEATSHATYPKG